MPSPFRARADRTVHATVPGILGNLELARYAASGKWYLEPAGAPRARNSLNLRLAAAASQVIAAAPGGHPVDDAGVEYLAGELLKVTLSDQWLVCDLMAPLGVLAKPVAYAAT
jgi:hypothetical protein